MQVLKGSKTITLWSPLETTRLSPASIGGVSPHHSTSASADGEGGHAGAQPTSSKDCKACIGQHRSHTCSKRPTSAPEPAAASEGKEATEAEEAADAGYAAQPAFVHLLDSQPPPPPPQQQQQQQQHADVPQSVPHGRVFKVTVNAGEALFIPEGWWHQVWSEAGTIAANYWFDGPYAAMMGGVGMGSELGTGAVSRGADVQAQAREEAGSGAAAPTAVPVSVSAAAPAASASGAAALDYDDRCDDDRYEDRYDRSHMAPYLLRMLAQDLQRTARRQLVRAARAKFAANPMPLIETAPTSDENAAAAESGGKGRAPGGAQDGTSEHAAKRARIAGDGDDDSAVSDGHDRFVGGARAGQCKLRCAACQTAAVAVNQPPFRRIGKLALWSVESVVESLVSEQTPLLRHRASITNVRIEPAKYQDFVSNPSPHPPP